MGGKRRESEGKQQELTGWVIEWEEMERRSELNGSIALYKGR